MKSLPEIIESSKYSYKQIWLAMFSVWLLFIICIILFAIWIEPHISDDANNAVMGLSLYLAGVSFFFAFIVSLPEFLHAHEKAKRGKGNNK